MFGLFSNDKLRQKIDNNVLESETNQRVFNSYNTDTDQFIEDLTKHYTLSQIVNSVKDGQQLTLRQGDSVLNVNEILDGIHKQFTLLKVVDNVSQKSDSSLQMNGYDEQVIIDLQIGGDNIERLRISKMTSC